MALVQGTDLRVFIGGNKIINEQTCDIELSTSMIETSSKDSGDWATAIPGRKSWGLSATFQVDYADPATTTTYDIIQAAWFAGTSLTVVFKTIAPGATILTGSAYVESMPVKSGDQTIATCDLKLKGTGTLVPTVAA
jgi:predicted secreted protein